VYAWQTGNRMEVRPGSQQHGNMAQARDRQKAAPCISCKNNLMVGFEPTPCQICGVVNQLCRCSKCSQTLILETGVACKVLMCARCVNMHQHVCVLNVGRFLIYEVEDACTCVSSISVDSSLACAHTHSHSVRTAMGSWIPEAAAVCCGIWSSATNKVTAIAGWVRRGCQGW
jgi:hypothetical protein